MARAVSAYNSALRRRGRSKKARREHFNDPPWGDPMTADEYIASHKGWGERLR